MSPNQQRFLAALLPASAFLLCFGMAAQAQNTERLPVDRPTQVDGIKAACTGIGNGEEEETRWTGYPFKLETVGGYGQWLGDQDVTVHGNGTDISVHCAGPWLLMGLQPGRYEATVADVIVRFHEKTTGSSVHPM